MKNLVIICLLITFINCQSNKFVATNEWQELEEGIYLFNITSKNVI